MLFVGTMEDRETVLVHYGNLNVYVRIHREEEEEFSIRAWATRDGMEHDVSFKHIPIEVGIPQDFIDMCEADARARDEARIEVLYEAAHEFRMAREAAI